MSLQNEKDGGAAGTERSTESIASMQWLPPRSPHTPPGSNGSLPSSTNVQYLRMYECVVRKGEKNKKW